MHHFFKNENLKNSFEFCFHKISIHFGPVSKIIHMQKTLKEVTKLQRIVTNLRAAET